MEYSRIYSPYRYALQAGDLNGIQKIIKIYEKDEKGNSITLDDAISKMSKEEDGLFLSERGLLLLVLVN